MDDFSTVRCFVRDMELQMLGVFTLVWCYCSFCSVLLANLSVHHSCKVLVHVEFF